MMPKLLYDPESFRESRVSWRPRFIIPELFEINDTFIMISRPCLVTNGIDYIVAKYVRVDEDEIGKWDTPFDFGDVVAWSYFNYYGV